MSQSKVAISLGATSIQLSASEKQRAESAGLLLEKSDDVQYLVSQSTYVSSSDAALTALAGLDGLDFNATWLRLLYLFMDQRDGNHDAFWRSEHAHHVYSILNTFVGFFLAAFPLYNRNKQVSARKKAMEKDGVRDPSKDGVAQYAEFNKKIARILTDGEAYNPDATNVGDAEYRAKCKEFSDKYAAIKLQLKRVGGTDANPLYEAVLLVEPSKTNKDEKKKGKKWWQPVQSYWDKIDNVFSTVWTLIILYMSAYWVIWVPFVISSWGSVQSGMIIHGNYAASLSLTIIIPALLFTLPYFAFRIFNNIEARYPHVKIEQKEGEIEEHNSDVAWVRKNFFDVKTYDDSFLKTAGSYALAFPFFIVGFFVSVGLYIKKGVAEVGSAVWEWLFPSDSQAAKKPLAKPDGTLRNSDTLAKDLGSLVSLVSGKELETPLLGAAAVAQTSEHESLTQDNKVKQEERMRLARLKQHYQDFTQKNRKFKLGTWEFELNYRRLMDAFVKFLVLTVSYYVVSQITLWVVSDAYLLIHHKAMISSASFNINDYTNLPGLAQAHIGGMTIGPLVGYLLFIVPPLLALWRVHREHSVGGKYINDDGEYVDKPGLGDWATKDAELRKMELEFSKETDQKFLAENRYPAFDVLTSRWFLLFSFLFLGTTAILMLRFMTTTVTPFLPFHYASIGSDLTYGLLAGALFCAWGAWKIYHMHMNSRDEMVQEDIDAYKHNRILRQYQAAHPDLHSAPVSAERNEVVVAPAEVKEPAVNVTSREQHQPTCPHSEALDKVGASFMHHHNDPSAPPGSVPQNAQNLEGAGHKRVTPHKV